MKNADQPAFVVTNNSYICPGLSKREYFAGLAMQAVLANPAINLNQVMGCNGGETHGHLPLFEGVKYAIDYADELLKQLETNPK